MSQRKLLITFLATLSIALLFFIAKPQEKKPAPTAKPRSKTVVVVHSSRKFDPDFYSQAYKLSGPYKLKPRGEVIGGIIPHHLLAAHLIAGFFDGLSAQKIATVVLIGPNHYNAGPHQITTSNASWSTLNGNVNPDEKKISQLIKSGVAQVDEDIFENEHSIYGITAFIKRSVPNAKIVPIIVNSTASRGECDQLVAGLESMLDDKTILVASVDFSHYLSSKEADEFDKQSLETINSLNLDRVFTLNSTKNFDSLCSIYSLLKFAKNRGAKPTLIANTNSAKLTSQPNLTSTTSYITLYFEKSSPTKK